MEENNSKPDSSSGYGCLLLCMIMDLVWKLYYAEKFNNYKIFLWSIPIYFVIFALLYWLNHRKKK